MTCWGADFEDLLSKGMRSCKELDWLQGLVQSVFKQRQAFDSEDCKGIYDSSSQAADLLKGS